VLPESFEPVLFFILPPGGFFVFAFFISLNLFLKSRTRDTPDGEAPEDESGTAAAGGHHHGGAV
jgi:hypothetical protein